MRHHSLLSAVHLTAHEVKHFFQLAQAHRSPQALAQRARIVLAAHAHPTWSSKQIARSLSANDRLVRKWRRRWQETHSLKDLPRTGAPRRFSSEVRAQVTALARSACLDLTAFLSLIGVEPNWPVMPQPFPLCPPLKLGRLGVGSPPSRSAPGSSILGNTSRIPRLFSNVPALCCTCMNKPRLCGTARHLGRLCR